MSRSNKSENIPNPAKRFFEWDGAKGLLRYYDKELKENVEVKPPFHFILLDRLATIRGWHDASESGIYSNEVKDTRNEPFVVRAFKMKDILAEGFYSASKDRIKALGGKFNANLYIAYLENGDETLSIGSLMFHGAPLSAWSEFEREHRGQVYEGGIAISGYKEGKKGKVTFRVPTFEIREVPQPTNDEATDKDVELQKYLKAYFAKNRKEQAQAPAAEVNGELVEDRTNHEPEEEPPF